MLADFEGRDFGDWQVTGESFGSEPAHGPLSDQAEVEPGWADKFGFDIRAIQVLYDIGRQKVYCAGKDGPLEPVNNKVKFHLLIDRTSLEVFANDGLLSMSSCMLPADDNKSIGVFCMGGQVKIDSLTVWELNSIWDK
jgi:hypothetical protein